MNALSSLRDVQGVYGSFMLSDSGGLLDKDLPAVFQDEVFEETGPRIVRVCEAVEHGGEALESLALRFADHKLHVRRSRGGLLCVIANADTNAPALKMALALLARRFGPSEHVARSEPPAAPSAAPLSTRSSPITEPSLTLALQDAVTPSPASGRASSPPSATSPSGVSGPASLRDPSSSSGPHSGMAAEHRKPLRAYRGVVIDE